LWFREKKQGKGVSVFRKAFPIPFSQDERRINMKACRTVINRFMLALMSAAAILLGCSSLLAIINAICRKFFLISLPWAEELCTYMVVIAAFIAIPFLELKDGQLSIGLLSSLVKNQKFMKVVFILRGVLIMVISLIVIRFGIASTQAAMISNTLTYVLKWPKYIFFAIAVGSFILVLVSWLSIYLINKGDKFE